MKLLMLCREPRLYSCLRLKEAAENSGHHIDILDPNRCLLKLNREGQNFQLYYQGSTDDKPYLLSDYDGVIPRFGSSSTRMGCAVLRHFAANDVVCLNDEQGITWARDKWQSLQILMQNQIAVPNSVLAGSEFPAVNVVKEQNSPMILKTLSGSQGIGVILAEQARSAVSILETLNQSQIPVLMQDFIEEAAGSDLRCFVIGGQVVASMQRSGQQGEFRANFHRGGTAQKIQLSEQEKDMAIKATKILGLDVAGVDLIRSHQGSLVLEVNASPGLEMIEKTSGIDIASQMIVYLEKKYAAKSSMTEV